MKTIYPEKLKKNDEIRVIAPSSSLAHIADDNRRIAIQRLTEIGFHVTFGNNVDETDEFGSSSIASRIADLHAAFSDKKVKAILSVLGGSNCNQLLKYIDWNVIKNNTKIFCGFSDITVLNNAIFAKTGLVTYSGPHYSTFGQKLYMDYTLEYFRKCLEQNDPLEILPSDFWTDDKWFLDQDKRLPIKNEGYLVINEGQAEGTLLGGNLFGFNILKGIEYFPNLEDSIIYLEDVSSAAIFDMELQSLILVKNFEKVKGLVLGRFQQYSQMENGTLTKIIKSKKKLERIPIIANVDFGHTNPMITFPIGGKVQISAMNNESKIVISAH